MLSVLKLAASAAVWRTTFEPRLVGLRVLLGTAILTAAVRILLQLAAAFPSHAFNPYGLNAVVAWIALELAVAALFVRPGARVTALSAMFMLSSVADLVTAAIRLGFPLIAPDAAEGPVWSSAVTGVVIFAVAVGWWIGAMACVIGSLDQRPRLRALGTAAAMWVALFAANALVPHAPVFMPPDFDARNANWWEVAYAYYREKNGDTGGVPPQVAQLERAQPRLLNAEMARLAPRKDATNVYALGIAGWADQDVFIKELDGGLESIGSVLPIKDRTVKLINNRATLGTAPLANPQNFAAAVRAIAAVMNKDQDVLVLFMTSHGEQTGFALQVPGKTLELTPQQVASALDGEGIKNRVVIVSACFAGIFLPPLANDNTIVMTAADATHTSFGCAPERDWTYFGDAFFRQSLHPGANFANAFEHARVLIQGWEMMDHDAPSNPQAHFGPALVDKLKPIFASAQNAGQ
ncbi:MAG TPA: C13 family peptidase [Xanthobacteraceae bacterium]|nr:C13 family peptidase [Xanthobacteraceae bacterium]